MSKKETSRGQQVVDVVKSDSVVSLGKEYLGKLRLSGD